MLCTPRHWRNNAPPKLTKRKSALRTRPSQAEKQNFSYPPAEKPDKPNFVVQLHRRARMNRQAGALKARSGKLGLRRMISNNESTWNFEEPDVTMLIYPRRIDWDQSQPRAHTCKLAEDDETPWRQAQQRPKPELRLETTATRVLCTPRHWCKIHR